MPGRPHYLRVPFLILINRNQAGGGLKFQRFLVFALLVGSGLLRTFYAAESRVDCEQSGPRFEPASFEALPHPDPKYSTGEELLRLLLEEGA